MYDSAFRWIMYDIPLNSSLGLVQFDTSASILSYLIDIKTSSDRNNLASKLPDYTRGSTCIGCGLQKALEVKIILINSFQIRWNYIVQVLRQSGQGGNIILMTDGGENESPTISQVMNDIFSAKVQVSTIAYGLVN